MKLLKKFKNLFLTIVMLIFILFWNLHKTLKNEQLKINIESFSKKKHLVTIIFEELERIIEI